MLSQIKIQEAKKLSYLVILLQKNSDMTGTSKWIVQISATVSWVVSVKQPMRFMSVNRKV